MYKDLCVAVRGYCLQKGYRPQPAYVTFFWANTNPVEIVLGGRVGNGPAEYWRVARNLLIAADLEFHRMAWAGGGDFAALFTQPGHDSRCMLSFQPGRDMDAALIAVLPAGPVRDFLAHTMQIVAPGADESEIVSKRLDAELAALLGGSE